MFSLGVNLATLEGEFLRYMITGAAGYENSSRIARLLKVQDSILSVWFSGGRKPRDGSLETICGVVFKELKERKNKSEYNQAEHDFKTSVYFLRQCQTGNRHIDDDPPLYAAKFLKNIKLLDEFGQITDVSKLENFLSANNSEKETDQGRSSQQYKEKQDQSKNLDIGVDQKHAFEAPKGESTLDQTADEVTVGRGYPATNYVGKICSLQAIEVKQSVGEEVKVHLNVNLGEETKEFGDLVVSAGLQKLRLKAEFANFRDIHSHQREGKLRGRIVLQNEDEGFVVEETYFGKPDPFLKDAVFEDEPLYSAKIADSRDSANIEVVCSIRFSDFELNVFDADGDRVENFTDRQKDIRKLALREFIKDRCKTRGFGGDVSIAKWIGHDKN